MWGPILAWIRKQIGQRTDAASATGSLHAKVADLKADIAAAERFIIASNTLQMSSDAEVAPDTGEPVKAKEIIVAHHGTVRVSFDMKVINDSYTAKGQIYINGIAKGTLVTNNSETYITYTEDYYAQKGDAVQLFASGGMSQRFRNFRLYWDYGAGATVIL